MGHFLHAKVGQYWMQINRLVADSANSPGKNLKIAATKDDPKGEEQDARSNPTRPTIFQVFYWNPTSSLTTFSVSSVHTPVDRGVPYLLE
jgi:hypothetical protein